MFITFKTYFQPHGTPHDEHGRCERSQNVTKCQAHNDPSARVLYATGGYALYGKFTLRISASVTSTPINPFFITNLTYKYTALIR